MGWLLDMIAQQLTHFFLSIIRMSIIYSCIMFRRIVLTKVIVEVQIRLMIIVVSFIIQQLMQEWMLFFLILLIHHF